MSTSQFFLPLSKNDAESRPGSAVAPSWSSSTKVREPVSTSPISGKSTSRRACTFPSHSSTTPSLNAVLTHKFDPPHLDRIPEAERGDMMKAYYTRLTSDDDKVRAEAGRAWSRWEMATSRVQVDPEYLDRAEDADFADKFARIEVRAQIDALFSFRGDSVN